MRIAQEDIKRLSEFLKELKDTVANESKFAKFTPLISFLDNVVSLFASYLIRDSGSNDVIRRVITKLEKEVSELSSKKRVTMADKYRIYAIRRTIEMIEEEVKGGEGGERR
jgi:hypothetical protein